MIAPSFSIFGVTFLCFAGLVAAVIQPTLNSEAEDHYSLSHDFIRTNYPAHITAPAADARIEYYSHLLSAHSNAEKDAWRLSQNHPYGPAHITYGRRRRNIYVTTKIDRSSQLGQRWGLGNPVIKDIDGSRDYKDLYAFWRVKQDGVKLLRLDAWKHGGVGQQIITWRNVMSSLRR